MANFVFNIAKGRVAEFFNRVDSNDPANSAIILVPLSAHLVAILPAMQTDGASQVAIFKVGSLIPSLELDQSVDLSLFGAPTHVTLTPASEASAATSLQRFKRILIGDAAQTDSAAGLITNKRLTLTPATETEIALAATSITAAPVGSVTIGMITRPTSDETIPRPVEGDLPHLPQTMIGAIP